MPVTIDIQNLQTTIPLNLARLKTKIQKVLKVEQIAQGSLSFVFVTDAKIKALNKKYLQHDYATDVLTFDAREKSKRFILEGEIVISTQTARRNAKEYGLRVEDEVLLYMIHGILHLLGYDDHSPTQIKKIRVKEKQLLRLLRPAGSQ